MCRSGFDLILRALRLPRGSEIIMSSVTIKDMVKIVEHYGYVPVPIDLDVNTLSCDLEILERSITKVYDADELLVWVAGGGITG